MQLPVISALFVLFLRFVKFATTLPVETMILEILVLQPPHLANCWYVLTGGAFLIVEGLITCHGSVQAAILRVWAPPVFL